MGKLIIKKINMSSVAKSSLINLILKPISMALSLVYVPILLTYLGDEKYGLWSTILTIINWINYFDVGIGHGLRNMLSNYLSAKDYDSAKKAVSTAYILLGMISTILLIVSVLVSLFIDWSFLFNTNLELKLPIIVSFIFICINFVLALANTLLYAMEMAERVAFNNCLIQLLNIVGVSFLIRNGTGSLLELSFLFGATTSVTYVINTINIFKKNKLVIPSLKYFRIDIIKDIVNVGIKFFIIQMACLALYTTDNLIITSLYGGKETTAFNVTFRIYNCLYDFLGAIVVPYWSKTTIAIVQKEFQWIKNSVIKLNILSILFCVGFIFITIGFKPIANIWLGVDLNYPQGLTWIMCLYYCLYSIVTVNVQFINGSGYINIQLILMIFMGVANIPLSIFFAESCNMGVVGVRVATTVLMLIAAIILPLNLKCIIAKIGKDNSHECTI